MNYICVIATILSHILAGLYLQKQKYSKLVTACLWSLYGVFALCVMLLIDNVVIGLFSIFILHFFVFYATTVGSIGEKTFLFLTYANSFCIFIGANGILSALLGDSNYSKLCAVVILILIHIFLYSFLIPTYKNSKIFFTSGWWKLNTVLILFGMQFLNQYAFNMFDRNSAVKLTFDFVLFSIIFWSTLMLLFCLLKDDAEKNKKTLENDVLKNVAYIDALTDLKNRAAYSKFVRRQMINYRNDNGKDFIFVILDIDGFKNINDTKGHVTGDEVLNKVGTVIAEHFEGLNCECFRIGGDEFVLLIEDAQLFDIDEHIRKMNDDLFSSIGVTLSYGCSEVDFSNPKPFDAALKTADEIMYSNKQQKKTYA